MDPDLDPDHPRSTSDVSDVRIAKVHSDLSQVNYYGLGRAVALLVALLCDEENRDLTSFGKGLGNGLIHRNHPQSIIILWNIVTYVTYVCRPWCPCKLLAGDFGTALCLCFLLPLRCTCRVAMTRFEILCCAWWCFRRLKTPCIFLCWLKLILNGGQRWQWGEGSRPSSCWVGDVLASWLPSDPSISISEGGES